MANFWYVLFGAGLIAATCGIVGVWLVLRKEALRGDVVSHGVLPGLCLAFWLYQEKNMFVLLLGAAASGLLSLWVIDYLQNHTKLKKDTIMAMVLSFFFALGLWILIKIQSLGNSAQSGLENFLFGKTASILPSDVLFALIIFIIVASSNFFLKKWLFWATFDPEYTQSIGLRPKIASYLLTFLSILAIVMGLQAVGVVMMSAMIITPATISLILSKNRLSNIFSWSIVINILVVSVGTLLSYYFPKSPTGPWIVVICSILAFMVFSIKKS
jgi:manganese/zinc/iron transport system permease protein